MTVFTALASAVTAFSAAASGTGIGAAFAALNATFGGQLIISLATSAILGALAPKPSAGKPRGYETNTLGSALDHSIIYGEVKVGGAIVYNEATGTDNKFLHRIIAVAGHEVESFERIWINDEYIDFADIASDGNIPLVYDVEGNTSDRYDGKLRLNFHYGTADQAADADLVAESEGTTPWTSDCKLSGIAYIYARLSFDADVYPDGIPVFTMTVKGKKVFNPATNTTVWSDNPALCIRDYLVTASYGLGEEDDNVDDILVNAAVVVCDELVGGETRYTCNGTFTTGATPYDLISSLLPSMGGTMWYAQGMWRMKPAYWTSPVMDLNEDDLRSNIQVSTRHSRRDNFNVVKGTFRGSESNWQTTDYKQVTNKTDAGSFVTGIPYSITEIGTTDFTAIGADSNTVGLVFTATGSGSGTGIADVNLGVDNGQVSVADVDLSFTDNMKEARRLGRISLEGNRQQLTVTASFALRTLELQVGDNIRVTNVRFGWTNKEFIVLAWDFGLTDDLDIQVQMTLKETAESVFDNVDDGAVYERDNTTLLSPFFVPLPSLDAAVVVTTMNEDGTAVPALEFSWTVSNSQVVDYYDFQWKLTSEGSYNSISTEETKFSLSPALSNKAYDYRVRAVNTLGVKSSYVNSSGPVSTGNDLTVPNAPSSLVATAGYSTVKLTWDAPTTNTDTTDILDLYQYRIFRGTSASPTALVGRLAGTAFTDGGLDDETTYYYRVIATDFTGNASAYSSDATVTTLVSPAGARGAGRYNIGVGSLPTTSSGANSDFESAIGEPVDNDQAWFYTGTLASPTAQGVWLYDLDTDAWTEQTEVIDGSLLVTGTVTANAINADAITGKNVTVGNLSATTVPTGSEKGARIQDDGTMFIGDKDEFLRWNGSVLSINGDIVNLGDFNKSPYSGGWSSFSATISLDSKFNDLGGEGLYLLFLVGAGGGGSGGGNSGDGLYALGGSSGTSAYFLLDWDGSSSLDFVSGSGGAGGSNQSTGSNGGSSLFKIGGSTIVTCQGGRGASNSSGTATAGRSAPSDPSNESISGFTGIAGSDGGSNSSTGAASGGGGVAAFGENPSSCRGGNVSTSNAATAGGGPFGRGNDTSSDGNYSGPSSPEISTGTDSSTSVITTSASGYFGGPSGNGPLSKSGFLGGFGSIESNASTAATGGLLAGGGAAITTGDYVATGGDGGSGGGGGGAHKRDFTSGDVPVAGDGGNGIIFFKKL